MSHAATSFPDSLAPRSAGSNQWEFYQGEIVLADRAENTSAGMLKRRTIYLISDFPRSDEPQWAPMADVYRIRTGWILKFDLAGVRPEDIRVRTEGCRITVSGTRRDSVLQEEGYSCYSMEISYNRFERTIELPCEFDNPRINLDFHDGILLVRVTQ